MKIGSLTVIISVYDANYLTLNVDSKLLIFYTQASREHGNISENARPYAHVALELLVMLIA